MEELTTNEAAKIIGCSIQHVRTMIRSNKLNATKHPLPTYGFYYTVPREEAERVRDMGQTTGFPRGARRR